MSARGAAPGAPGGVGQDGAPVVVVGGGLAGITAALACADAGLPVTLLETRPRLGGATSSFRRGELVIDNGQHVFLRCCTAYRGLLARLGTAHLAALQPRLDIPVLAEGGRSARLRRSRLPAPLHLAGSLARYGLISWPERIAFARAARALQKVDRDDPATDRQSFGGWLARHGQSPAAIAALWDLVGVATLNAKADAASLSLAATVFQVGLLSDADAGDVGVPSVPLQVLHGDAAGRALADAGVQVHLATKATEIERRGAGWAVHTRAGGCHESAALVLAVPAETAAGLLPDGALPGPASRLAALGRSPIVNVHVHYDRRVLDEPFVAGVGTPVQWMFDRTGPSGAAHGQYVALSLSAADEYVDRGVHELRAQLLPAVERLLPRAGQARVLDFFVTRERAATFRPAPGTAVLRPGPVTGLPGLFLAGAWTATGWPATMEGAVRSGAAAADAALVCLAAPRRGSAGTGAAPAGSGGSGGSGAHGGPTDPPPDAPSREPVTA
jgi:squalene-associated FAD-dependent desaturase